MTREIYLAILSEVEGDLDPDTGEPKDDEAEEHLFEVCQKYGCRVHDFFRWVG